MHAHGVEIHRSHRAGWLRAAVLGANDGIVSTASLVLGVAAAEAGRNGVLTAGLAGLVAGAMSMAAGEYVSVHSQKDAEEADLAKERLEIEEDPEIELEELTQIYRARGVDEAARAEVADLAAARAVPLRCRWRRGGGGWPAGGAGTRKSVRERTGPGVRAGISARARGRKSVSVRRPFLDKLPT